MLWRTKVKSLCLVSSHAKVSLVHHWARLSLRGLRPKTSHPGWGLWLSRMKNKKVDVNFFKLCIDKTSYITHKYGNLLYTKSLLIPCLPVHSIGWHLPAVRHVLTVLLRIAVHLIPVSPLTVLHLWMQNQEFTLNCENKCWPNSNYVRMGRT